MKLLLVEDSPRLQRSLCLGLRRAGFAVDSALDGEEGLWLARQNSYDAIVLDLMLPKLDGLSVLRALREEGNQTHVLILTARGEVEDRVLGLDSGGDDYLAKPFEFDELLARVRALIRRAHGRKAAAVRVGDLEIDLPRRRVARAGEEIPLAPREFKLLELFVHRNGEVLTRADIEACIYDERAEPMSNVVDSAICTLRKKLDPPGGGSLIQTRRGHGYILEPAP